MARKFAQLHCDIWEDRDFLALTPEARFVFVACFAQKIVNYCGVLVYSPARMARVTGYKPGQVSRSVAELEQAGFVVHDEDTGEILVRSFIANNNICAQPQLRKAMERCFDEILSERLRAAVVAGLPATYTGSLRAACEQPAGEGEREGAADPAPRPRITGSVVATDSSVTGNPGQPDSLTEASRPPAAEALSRIAEVRSALTPVPDNGTHAGETEAAHGVAGTHAVAVS